jgi:hypothetical protein
VNSVEKLFTGVAKLKWGLNPSPVHRAVGNCSNTEAKTGDPK